MNTRAVARPGSDSVLGAAVVDHYENALRRHGPSARGMDWKDEASQRLRFAVLCEGCDLRDKSVHEIGAGAGHLVDFLAGRGIDAAYSGSDLSGKMVAAARARHPEVSFERRDLLRDPRLERFDVVLASGVFNVKLHHSDEEWWRYVRKMIHAMFALCREVTAFNLMTDQVDFRSETLFYANPADILDFCRHELSRYVTLRLDYPLHEYTVHVYRAPNGFGA